ncbi:RimK-like ATP-grasp domain-containing protein [Streptomyces sp. DvalAA-14]|uniref:ATP-grasp domain-containing protein n=1 Tax=unclassified Streptomyces TaxID=2593676 RepID=UPI00081B38E2|nr:alpha-L-glutamate ligase [Streptomyces sp. DvalAA-14]MYS23555.1 alpha-L-glutamate ligase [Streptomyces sp. SID4948]SCE35276.1 RimK-like ATP-grasp domain-containing protein [Streptomyces sp. DvalAA-14]
MKAYVIHENPDWYPPFAAAFEAEGVEHEQWLLGEGVLDLDAEPPQGVFWSRMSASAHTRGHELAKDHTRSVLNWLEAHGRRVVNGRRVLELEMSKVDQLTALRAAGIEVPRTLAVVGRGGLLAAAAKLPLPFIVKHNQGGKGLGVALFDSVDAFADHLAAPDHQAPVDGVTLLQEYLPAAEPRITRVEIVDGAVVYALTADTARGGFELCPADACAIDGGPDAPSLFALREGFDHPVLRQYLDFARQQGIEVAGFEFIETTDGRLVTYDVNTNTNYNPEVEGLAPRSGPRQIARLLKRLIEEEETR